MFGSEPYSGRSYYYFHSVKFYSLLHSDVVVAAAVVVVVVVVLVVVVVRPTYDKSAVRSHKKFMRNCAERSQPRR